MDIENAADRSGRVITKLEEIENSRKTVACSICSSTACLEICLECFAVVCRFNSHVQEHWKSTWHKSYFVPHYGAVSCEECGEYLIIEEIEQLAAPEKSERRAPSGFEQMSTSWVKGFLNLKKTCYLSSLLQSILSIRHFINSALDGTHTLKKCKREECVMCIINKILYQMYNDVDGYIDVSALITALWKSSRTFALNEYQDVQECFIQLTELVHAQHEKPLNEAKEGCDCPAHSSFGGAMVSSVCCCVCGEEERSEEPFTAISMDLIGEDLPDAMDKFFGEERVCLERACRACGGKEYRKRLKMVKSPKILTVNLKRYQVKNKIITKIEKILTYPEDLKILDKEYELSSVILHIGEIDSGHYITYTKRNTQWYLTNDEEITRVSKTDVLDKPAYLLFYSERQ